jgi:4'-phosphopantetheinyl transferase
MRNTSPPPSKGTTAPASTDPTPRDTTGPATEASWPVRAPARRPPPPGEAWCWRIVIEDIVPAAREGLFATMDGDEQARCRRFVQERDQRSFAAAHGGLRLLLGAMLGAPPGALRFAVGEFGKPRLDGNWGIEFNMSHGDGIVLIALSRGQQIGVDVEGMRPVSERAEIVRRYLHPGEAADLVRLGGREAEAAFFRCWSRKEAVVKALGRGMNLDLHRYRVTCAPGAEPMLLALEGENAPGEAWSLHDLAPGPNHVGALAARLRPFGISCRGFDANLALGLAPRG